VFDRITFDPNIMGGRACIRGMRIPVSVIVGQLAAGATPEEVLRDFPDLSARIFSRRLPIAPGLRTKKSIPRSTRCDFSRTWGSPK
jgi:hypothetical protein